MDIVLVGEDEVTREIIKRILIFSGKDFNITREDPIRGGEIKNKILNYNKLASEIPVILLTDMDAEVCPITLIEKWFNGTEIHPNLIFRVAYNEAESWLMSDKKGISKFLSVPMDKIPDTIILDKKNQANVELKFKYKPSLFLMNDLMKYSSDDILKDQLQPQKLAKKGREYNSVLIPFIREKWNIESAIQNSYSLKKAVERIIGFKKK